MGSTLRTWPLSGTNLWSLHKYLAPKPVQLTIMSYFGSISPKELVFLSRMFPPICLNFSVAQGRYKLHSVRIVVKNEPYFQVPGHNFNSSSVAALYMGTSFSM